MKCDTIEKWAAQVPGLRAEFAKPETFSAVYNYTFKFAREKGKTNVEIENAIALWNLLWPRGLPILKHWCEYHKQEQKKG